MKNLFLCICFLLCLIGSAAAQEIKTIRDSVYNFELIKIPAGTMKVEASRVNHAMDVHIESFYMGKYEVTQKLWKAVMGAYPQQFNFEDYPHDNARINSKSLVRMKEIAEPTGFIGDELPVENVSWESIKEFLKRLNKETGHNYRLPTQEEWIYAYRAGTDTKYYFGDDTLLVGDYEWYDENSDGKTHPVGQKKPNPWGLYDIGGNVGEWTSTIADMEPYRRLYPNREWSILRQRVYRGSHYLHTKFAAAYNWGHSYSQVHPHNCVGLRLVREE